MATYYLDTSAIYKRVQVENGSQALVKHLTHLSQTGSRLLTSALTWIELERSLRRYNAQTKALDELQIDQAVKDATLGLDQVRITSRVVSAARWIGPLPLRSLDAIHLASAVLSQATVLVTYDQRLIEAARSVKLAVESPV